MIDSIILSAYQTDWVKQFEEEQECLLRAFNSDKISIEHIGSTSVPNLTAKPIIDIMVGLEDLALFTKAHEILLEKLGYEVRGECGIPGRIFCRKGMPRTHHVHIVQEGSMIWNHHLIFRDYLRNHTEAAQAYEKLKQSLAQQFAHDRSRYTEGKNDFITMIIQKAQDS